MNYLNTNKDLQGSRIYGVGGLKMIQEDWVKTSQKINSNTIDKQKSHNKRS